MTRCSIDNVFQVKEEQPKELREAKLRNSHNLALTLKGGRFAAVLGNQPISNEVFASSAGEAAFVCASLRVFPHQASNLRARAVPLKTNRHDGRAIIVAAIRSRLAAIVQLGRCCRSAVAHRALKGWLPDFQASLSHAMRAVTTLALFPEQSAAGGGVGIVASIPRQTIQIPFMDGRWPH